VLFGSSFILTCFLLFLFGSLSFFSGSLSFVGFHPFLFGSSFILTGFFLFLFGSLTFLVVPPQLCGISH
ncbi:hypothetical protein, partial [Heyndrickxia oleronia]|uniref:hypothetical protein n=1 Tax=Heyndrickxia oleronia TaxID=38875 RepID=UPI001B809906